MKTNFIYALAFATLFLVSCSSSDSEDPKPVTPVTPPTPTVKAPYDQDDIQSSASPTTFGIRHDKQLTDYENLGANTSPYNTTDYPDFTSTVFIQTGDGENEYTATGALIGANWVLTASHNFYVHDEAEKGVFKPENTIVRIGADPNNPTAEYEVEQIILHPTWIADGGGFENGNDVALVKLKSAVSGVTPVAFNATVDAEKVGAIIWYAGYGDYSQQSGQNADALTKRHAMPNILDRAVGGLTSTVDGVSYPGGVLAFDFDAPDGSKNTLGDDIANEQEKLLGDGSSNNASLVYEGGTVQGDSGGPVFMKINDKWIVVGVLHGGVAEVYDGHKDSSYGDISVFTRIASCVDWIKSTTGL